VQSRRGRVGIVPLRYGEGVVGGSEAVLREAAHGLAGRGWDVEVLTTCARDHYTWANVYPAGTSQVDGVLLRRFPAVVDTPRELRARLGHRILAGERLTIAEQERWINDDLRVPELFHYLLDEAVRYRALIFSPYLFWPAFACSQLAPERTVLMPCLHDEPFAQLDVFQPMFSGVRGMWFLTEPEHALAHRMFAVPAQHAVTGAGVDAPASYDPNRFRSRFRIPGRFALYAGRREGAKGWEDLLEGFARAVSRTDLPLFLVTIGVGDVVVPGELRDRVIDLGFLGVQDRNDAFAAADVYLQPSVMESFSRTVMEAWLAGTPVIANAGSEVVRWHCERSGAGLVYDDVLELEQCLLFVASEPDAARELARPGRDYVRSTYSWDATLDRMEASLEEWL
jgi:glycosyltransferase involved in cell wall biosynthesis